MILERAASAKVNLGLHVLRRRPDGYHDIETVFLPVPWRDRLYIEQANEFSFACSDPSLPLDGDNLCVRAARFLQTLCGEKHGALHLEKRIPYGAGLGGGSSDAAATLLLLRDFWRLAVSDADLHELAQALGSDVPFFLHEGAAFGTGRGEVLEPLCALDSKEPYIFPFHLLIVVPDVHVSTAEAYKNIAPNDKGRSDLRSLVASNDLALWRETLVNDFEPSVFGIHPLLLRIKNRLLESGAGYAAMTGSGSALFGVYEDASTAHRAGLALSREGFRCWWEEPQITA